MTISLFWVTIAVAVQGSVAGAQWPPLRITGLLGVEKRGTADTGSQPASPKKPGGVPAPIATPVAPKADKPVGEGSFDDFGFGPETGTKPTLPAAGADAGKTPGKTAPSTAAKPQAGAVVSKPIGPVRLTARPEPLPRLMPVTATAAAPAPLPPVAPPQSAKDASKAAAKPESETGFVKGRRVK